MARCWRLQRAGKVSIGEAFLPDATSTMLILACAHVPGVSHSQALMYGDPARWSFTFQTYVQLTMLQIHRKLQVYMTV